MPLWLLIGLKGLLEVLGALLVARGAVFLLSGRQHQTNPVWRGLRRATWPAEWLTRSITPRIVMDRHIPLLTFILIAWAWVLLVLAKAQA